MTQQEKTQEELNYQIDKQKREELINEAINLPFKNNVNLRKPHINEIIEFYQSHLADYGKFCTLPYEKYVMACFWFNDAGFQFQWRNHKFNIKLECLAWKEVYKRLI